MPFLMSVVNLLTIVSIYLSMNVYFITIVHQGGFCASLKRTLWLEVLVVDSSYEVAALNLHKIWKTKSYKQTEKAKVKR